MPEIKLPEVRLPEGLREMRREDIQQTMADFRMPKVERPKNLRLPKFDVDLPKVDLSKIEMPAGIEDRMPGRKRRNPIPMLLAAGVAIGAAVWLVAASPLAPAIRRAARDLRSRLGMTDVPMEELDELDDELELQGPASGFDTGYETGTGPGAFAAPAADGRSPVPVGPGDDLTQDPTQPAR